MCKKKKKYNERKYIPVYNNQVYVQILINHTPDRIIRSKSKSFEVFRYFRDIDLSKKCLDVSCIELISDMSKIWAFY